MNKQEKRWVRIVRESKNELRVDVCNSSEKEYSVLQSEQGAMIEVGAVIGANMLNMKDGDILEVDLVMIRKGVRND